ncbi:tetratricopeptide repeat protein [Sorangium sp. So ce1078]|uniref:tetratricopeptide repeat protein n=1 Tax=Sorangium sp. So ce1078 TaxID=3133329 RepID=UPI003F5E5D68
MDAPRPSGTRRALLIGLPLAALAAAAFLFMNRDEPPAPKARPSSVESSADTRPQRRDEPSLVPSAPTPAAAIESAAAQESEAAPAAPDTDPEARVIDRMRAALASDPEEVIRLDDAASRDFGDSPRAAERGLLRVRALVRTDRTGQARSLAEDLVERYPDDPSAKSAAAYMGIHPRPRGPSR